MSRVPRLDVWEQEFKHESWGICPCCKSNIIHFVENKGDEGWNRGHIIPMKHFGADLLINLRPICLDCNENDQKFPTNYDYMVFLGTMTKDTAVANIAKLKADIEHIHKYPETIVCIKSTKFGKACQNKRKPHSLFCRKCYKDLLYQLNGNIKKSHNHSLVAYSTQLKTLLETGGDQNETLSLMTIVNDFQKIRQ